MKKTQRHDENRRAFMRVQARLHFCISVIEGIEKDTGKINYGACFCTTSADISLGGVCVAHKGALQVGFDVEVSTPEKMNRPECLSCEKAFLFTNPLPLQIMRGKVVWATPDRCGISFENLSIRNENILSKYIWDEHLDNVRTAKRQVEKQRKF